MRATFPPKLLAPRYPVCGSGLRIRLGRHYAKLSRGGIGGDRLRLCQLCMHLDLVAGPLRVAGTGHPEREWFRSLAEPPACPAVPGLTSWQPAS